MGDRNAAAAPAETWQEEQERLTNEAKNVVKQQGFYMMRALDKMNLRDALKHSSNMICELRTSMLSPKNYYELYMDVVNQLLSLEAYFYDEFKKGKRISELYELVQHAGNILPRMYLLITVGSVYIRSKAAPAKEILRDLVEMSRGVQHPMRGLFLRNYLTLMCKDKLPEKGGEYEGVGGDVGDSIEFCLQNFQEMNRLWVRMQHQGPVREREKRERERLDLRLLVGKNLDRLSQLEGLDIDHYKTTVLPRVAEQIISCKDQIAQQYLMDCAIQAFPDEFHLDTLGSLLGICPQLQPQVDLQAVLMGLMNRLSEYFANQESTGSAADTNIFETFTSNVQNVIEKNQSMSTGDVLGLQVSLLNFSLKCYPNKLDYVDTVLSYCAKSLEARNTKRLDHVCVRQIVQLLTIPLESYPDVLTVLELQKFPVLMNYIQYSERRKVAMTILQSIHKRNAVMNDLEKIEKLFMFISPLTKSDAGGDDDSTDEDDLDDEEFAEEQNLVARLVHVMQHDNTDVVMKMYNVAKGYFQAGGKERIRFTYPPLICGSIKLALRCHEREKNGDKGETSCKKVFQHVHRLVTGLVPAHPESAMRLFLEAAKATDLCSFESISYEFVTQAFTIYEEEISDSKAQFAAIVYIVGALHNMTNFSEENFDTLITKGAQYSAKLLKKPDQCRAVYICSHLFWSGTRNSAESKENGEAEGEKPKWRDGKRVMECLKKCLKIADASLTAGHAVALELFVEILNQYIYFYNNEMKEVTPTHLTQLIALIRDHMGNADVDHGDTNASEQFESTVGYIKRMKKSKRGERFHSVDV